MILIKKAELEHFLRTNNIDVAAISETNSILNANSPCQCLRFTDPTETNLAGE